MPARRGLLADAGEWRACVCGPPPLAYVQATFFRRRHQPRRPALAKIRPGRPAPAMGAGTTDRFQFLTSSIELRPPVAPVKPMKTFGPSVVRSIARLLLIV